MDIIYLHKHTVFSIQRHPIAHVALKQYHQNDELAAGVKYVGVESNSGLLVVMISFLRTLLGLVIRGELSINNLK